MDTDGASTLRVNGESRLTTATPETPLIYVLRNDLGLRGVRAGCAIGSCGACTVLLAGQPTRSCITPLSAVAGSPIITPEGLGGPDSPHPVQQAFLDEQAAQCGYCVNGIIMTAAALAERRPSPAHRDVREALANHLCRCGTHQRLARAFCRAVGVPAEPVAQERMAGAAAEATKDTVGSDDVSCTGVDSGHSDLPASLVSSPTVERWLCIMADGRVRADTGKVELGQGIRAALGRIVATELGIASEFVDVASTTTNGSPDEGYTAGSASLDQGGVALAMAAAAMRRMLLDRAARHLSVAADEISVEPSGVLTSHSGRRVSFAALVAESPLTGPIEATDRPDWTRYPVGQVSVRRDLRAKLTGEAAFVHDMVLPGMLHARALLPPTYDAQLEEVDLASVRELPGIAAVVRDGNLVLTIGEREEQTVRAAKQLARTARWSDPGLDLHGDPAENLRRLVAEPFVARQDEGTEAAFSCNRTIRSSYAKPYQSHASIAPSCAVAIEGPEQTAVWTHTQGVYPLRRELAALLGEPEERFTVHHADGPGCYGQNGADDVAALAVLAAKAVPGRPVRLQFSVEDEFGWEPHGPAMVADLKAALDGSGHLVAWRHHTTTDVHSSRPAGSGDRLLAAWLRPGGPPRPWPGPMESGARNATPLYDIAHESIVAHHVRGPVRTGTLRSLGSYLNVFASESFVDEAAEFAGRDPVTFRLEHLSDSRARRVLEVAAESAGWVSHIGPSGRGQGLALARYKGTKAYAATVIDLAVDQERRRIAVQRILVVCDAGSIIDPDGLRNQIEGGALQGLSRAMYEELDVDSKGIHSRDWTTYSVLGFDDVPPVDVVLVDGSGRPPLGAGEAATPPIPAALANALDDAVGVRLRVLPINYGQLERRLMALGETEMDRVRL
jgi:CO/xanthine dehydrogenase Mo-binding subunit/aerobic-type carbon monoxide dehydrogenase small subunit (CoxS/CutS family)